MSLELLFHFLLGKILFGRVENAHGFKVEGANTAHENLLEVLLHHVSVSIVNVGLSFSFVEFVPQSLYLLLICSTDTLQLNFYGVVELFFISFHLGCLETLYPGLEHISHLVFSVSFGLVIKHTARVLLELFVIF